LIQHKALNRELEISKDGNPETNTIKKFVSVVGEDLSTTY
jgi:hypothetical protein